MAHFAQRKTGYDITCWEYYMKLPNWQEFIQDSVVTNVGKTAAFLQSEIFEPLIRVFPGDKIEVVSNEGINHKKSTYAKVIINGVYGLLNVKYISKMIRNTLTIENTVVTALDTMLKERGVCNVQMKSDEGKIQIIRGVTGCKQVQQKPDPKADFYLHDVNGTPLFYFSHKKGGGAKSFQQYQSITGKSQDFLNNNPFVQKILRKLKDLHQSIVDDRVRYKAEIDDPKVSTEIVLKSVYGCDFGNSFGVNNCHALAKGLPILDGDSGDVFLTWDDGLHFNGETNWLNEDEYKPTILARYSAERNFYIDGEKFSGVRLLICPAALCSASARNL